jgi:hypothetical protein
MRRDAPELRIIDDAVWMNWAIDFVFGGRP